MSKSTELTTIPWQLINQMADRINVDRSGQAACHDQEGKECRFLRLHKGKKNCGYWFELLTALAQLSIVDDVSRSNIQIKLEKLESLSVGGSIDPIQCDPCALDGTVVGVIGGQRINFLSFLQDRPDRVDPTTLIERLTETIEK